MRIERWTGPPADTHAYLVIDDESGDAWAIDAPLDTAAPLLARVRDEGLTLSRLVLTHGHFDHILDAGLYQAAGIPVAAHPFEREMLDTPQTALFGLPHPMPEVRIDEPLTEGTRLRLGQDEWEVWHVPGHSPGHVLLYSSARKTVFGGDMLFQGGYGRVDLPACRADDMAASLRRLMELPMETRVYPGHGPDTTIGAERGWLSDITAGRLL